MGMLTSVAICSTPKALTFTSVPLKPFIPLSCKRLVPFFGVDVRIIPSLLKFELEVALEATKISCFGEISRLVPV